MTVDGENDRILLKELVDESLEALSELPPLIVKIEHTPDDLSLINTLFRPIHSLKSNAAFFGLFHIKQLAHNLETVLDQIRSGKLKKKVPTDQLLNSIDALSQMLANVNKGCPEIDNEDQFNKLLSELRSVLKNEDANQVEWKVHIEKLHSLWNSLVGIDELLASALMEIIKNAEKKLTQEGNSATAAVPPPIEIETLAAILNKSENIVLNETEAAALEENLLSIANIPSLIGSSIIHKALENFKTIVNTIGYDRILIDTLSEALQQVCASNNWTSPLKTSTSQQQQEKIKDLGVQNEPQPSSQTQKTMRVAEERIDEFLAYVGELIVVRDMLEYVRSQIESTTINVEIVNTLRDIAHTFEALSYNLQKSIMSIRRIPIRTILQKVPRLVRDTASTLGKEVAVVTHGEEIGVDKSIIDSLEAPIVHLVRNAVDHGIELPAERTAKGKPKNGIIKINVSELPDFIVIAISDDGKGIDFEAVAKKGVNMGLLSSGSDPTQEQLVDLLFLPGFSTSQKVTEISGRGVGMDVVMQAIKQNNGTISVESDTDKGSCFTLRLPRTIGTRITMGMLVQSNDTLLVFLLDSVIESFNRTECIITTIPGQGRTIKRKNRLSPLYSLREILKSQKKEQIAESENYVVCLKAKTGTFAVSVDQIVGIRQMVIKELDNVVNAHNLFIGAALVENRSIALVVDTEAFMQSQESLGKMTTAAA